jgi:hypothetical protein
LYEKEKYKGCNKNFYDSYHLLKLFKIIADLKNDIWKGDNYEGYYIIRKQNHIKGI